jgi:hypothetical protein
MRTLILNSDLKTIFIGAAFAVGLGIVGGAAMEPNLRADGGPAGPQILAGESGPRRAADENPYAVYAAYPQTLPDYVIGSDWLKPATPEESIYQDVAMTGDETSVYEVSAAPEAPAAPTAPVAPEAQDQAELEELAAATPG